MDRHSPFLIGQEIYLRPLVESDAGGSYPTWFNDETVCQGNAHHTFPYTIEQAHVYIQEANQDSSRLVLAIVCCEDESHIGNITLDTINYINRTAQLAIIIGDKTSWGKGYGKEATHLICDHGFCTLNLNRIYCSTFETNIGMQKLADYLGMLKEGRRRQAVYKLGRYIDVIEYGVLKDEYMKRFNFLGTPPG